MRSCPSSPTPQFRTSLERYAAAREGTHSASTVSSLCLTALGALLLAVPLLLKAGNGSNTASATDPEVAGCVPRYAVIDLGTNFFPVGINNSNIVVGNIGSSPTGPAPAIWNWASSTTQVLPVNSAYEHPTTDYSVVGIDDAGNIAGNIACGNASDGGQPFPPSLPYMNNPFFVVLGCYWANGSTTQVSPSTPIALGLQESSGSGVFYLNKSFITSVSHQGYMVGTGDYGAYTPSHAEAYSQSLTIGGTNTAQVLYPPNPWAATNYGYLSMDTNCQAYGAGGATNWCGFEYQSPGGVGSYPVINGTAYTAATYSNLWVQAINDSNIAAGGNGNNAVIVSPGAGTSLLSTNLGPGYGYFINNALDTNGVPAPQVIGYDTNSPGKPMLWDKTDYADAPSTNAAYAANGYYVGKLLTGLLANTTTNNTWTMTSVSGLNTAGCVIGSATYSGTNTAIPAGPHGVLLWPLPQYFLDQALTQPLDDWPATSTLLRSPKHILAQGDNIYIKVKGPSGLGNTKVSVTVTSDSDTNGISVPLAEVSPGVYEDRAPALPLQLGTTTGTVSTGSSPSALTIKVMDKEVLKFNFNINGIKLSGSDVMVLRGKFASCGIDMFYGTNSGDQVAVRAEAITSAKFFSAGDQDYPNNVVSQGNAMAHLV